MTAVAERLPAERAFPFDLPFVQNLDLCFRSAVTFFVGENGSGKSTLLEAIAVLSRLRRAAENIARADAMGRLVC